MILSTAYCPPVEFFAILAGNSPVYIDSSERYQKQSWRNRCRILTANGPMDLRFPIVHNGRYGITEVQVDYSTPWTGSTEYAIESAYSSSPFFIYYKDELFSIFDSRPSTLWELNSRLIDFFCRKIGLPTPPTDCVSGPLPLMMPRAAQFCRPAAAAPTLSPLMMPRAAQFCGPAAAAPTSGTAPRQNVSQSSTPPTDCVSGPLPLMVPRAAQFCGGAVPDVGERRDLHPKRASSYAGKPYWQVFRDKFGFVDGLSILDLLFCEGPESICYL